MNTNHAYFEQEHMVDRFLAGTLSEEEAKSFQDHFMECSLCLSQLELEESLRAAVCHDAAQQIQEALVRPPKSRIWASTKVWALAAVLLAGLNLFQFWADRSPQGPSSVKVLNLTQSRGWTDNELTLDFPGQAIVLRQSAPDVAVDLVWVTLMDQENQLIWAKQLPKRGDVLEWVIPGADLRAGMYCLELKVEMDQTPISSFWFSLKY